MANQNPSASTRFQPGQSGNPGGRPKGISLSAILVDELSEARARTMIRAIIRKASKGDVRAFEQLIERIDGKVTDKLALAATTVTEIHVGQAELDARLWEPAIER